MRLLPVFFLTACFETSTDWSERIILFPLV